MASRGHVPRHHTGYPSRDIMRGAQSCVPDDSFQSPFTCLPTGVNSTSYMSRSATYAPALPNATNTQSRASTPTSLCPVTPTRPSVPLWQYVISQANSPFITFPTVVQTPVALQAPVSQDISSLYSTGWVPHPRPHPTIPANMFWNTALIYTPTWQAIPLDSAGITSLTGGWPLPGMALPNWTPGAWPPASTQRSPVGLPNPNIILCPWLIPNPTNPAVPHLVWDVTQSPMTAVHINARGSIVNFTSKLDDPVTHPPVRTVHIYCNSWMAHNQWGPIVIDKWRTVNVWDVLIAIYDFCRVPLTQQEVQHISSLDGDNYRRMLDAYYQRCMRTPALPGYEVQQGMKRADCLGRNTIFWGLWITLNVDNTWQMNLGLVPPSHS